MVATRYCLLLAALSGAAAAVACDCPGRCPSGPCDDPARPWCTPVGTCGECLDDADCGNLARPRCGWAWRCVECVEDGDCPIACAGTTCAPCILGTNCFTDCGPGGECLPCSEKLPCIDFLGCTEGECAPCATDADCPGETVCRESLCGTTCSSGAWCVALFTAVGGGSAPSGGLRALFGCHHFGFTPSACGESPYWSSEEIRCEACTDGAACTLSCDLGECTCATTDDCDAGLVCVSDVCAPCREDLECPCDAYCAAGRCRPLCNDDADCPDGRCDPVSARCLPCMTDADCTYPALCYEDGCEIPCQLDNWCPDYCDPFGGRCSGCEHFTLGPPSLPPPAGCP